MKPGQACVDLIKQFEGCSLHAYLDQKNIPTIGYGHTHNVTPRMACTSDQALTWLNEDLVDTSNQIDKVLKVNLSQNQYDAVCSLVFNIGIGNFAGSHLLEYLNSNEMSLAAAEFLKWDHTNGQVNDGLLRRRQAEQALFLS